MKKSRKSLLLSLLIVFILSLIFSQSGQTAAKFLNLIETEKQQILSVTIQIFVYPAQGIEYERSMGTLFGYGGQTFILTHNHWEMLTTSVKVEFRDWQNQSLLTISGTEFLELVCFRDRGSIVLIAPSALSSSKVVMITDIPLLLEAEEVTLVHHHKGDHRLDIMIVKVVRVNTDKRTASFNIIPPNGEKITPGDSGGGIWHDGKLVGNMWAFYLETKQGFLNLTPSKEIQVGVVAQLPFNYLQTYQKSGPDQPVADELECKEKVEP